MGKAVVEGAGRGIVAVVLLVLGLPVGAAEVADECFERLPFGCFVIESATVDEAQTAAIGKKLGVPIERLSNTVLQVQGTRIQVNVFDARTDAEASRLHKTVSEMHGHPAMCLIRGRKLYEFCKADVTTAIKTAYELGLVEKPQQVRYLVTALVATVDKADYMSSNELSNVFFRMDPQAPSEEVREQIERLSRGLTFGTSLALRHPRQEDGSLLYRLTAEPAGTEDLADHTVYTFSKPRQAFGVPYVALKVAARCNDRGTTPTDRRVEESLLSATPYWPVDDPEVTALAKEITAGKRSPETKVEAILDWLAPGRNANITSTGPSGSRWGVKKVLQQKYGHCWDRSDCFVTLARAVGVPARQVGGWLYGSCGHIWAEVLIDGKEWQQVDPSGGSRLKCGIYHIPYFTTETGEMPILYLTKPKFEILEGA
jgi:NAD(P)-dependent dehydrogenase (short-subunit alcohol dehydrogenase family)